jgi:UDP-N-acetylglucosamine 1-carboxyvinyltransferase
VEGGQRFDSALAYGFRKDAGLPATVIGQGENQRLRASTMSSPDIRAGIALLIAALCAEGTSTIHNIDQIDRGYQDIDKRLNALGANIKRL